MQKALTFSLFVLFLLLLNSVSTAQNPDDWKTLIENCDELKERGELDSALSLGMKALEVQERLMGPDAYSVSQTLKTVAGVFHFLGRVENAENFLNQALSIIEKSGQNNYQDKALILLDLGDVHESMSGSYRSDDYYEEAMELAKENEGAECELVAICYKKLALTEYDDKQAEIYCKKALDIYKKLIGNDNPQFAHEMSLLGIIYANNEKYRKAEKILTRSLKIKEKTLDSTDIFLQKEISNLARVYFNQEKYDKAEPYYKRLLVIQEAHYGADHQIVAFTLGNLADNYVKQGNYKLAESLYLQKSKVSREAIKNGHLSEYRDIQSLAYFYLSTNNFKMAKSVYETILRDLKTVLGHNHSDVGRVVKTLAGIYDSLGKYERAESFYLRALEISELDPGYHHMKLRSNLESIVNFYVAMNNPEEAKKYEQRLEKVKEEWADVKPRRNSIRDMIYRILNR